MNESGRRLLAMIAAATLLCGGMVVQMTGAPSGPSATSAGTAAARERAPGEVTRENPGLRAPTWEGRFLVHSDLAEGVVTDDHPLMVVAPPGTGPRSSVTCSAVGEDGSQTCMTLTVDTDALDDVAMAPREAPVRVLAPESRPAAPGATTGTPDEDTDR